jgi:hypothetical protein
MYPFIVNSTLSLAWLACGLCFLLSPAPSARHLGYQNLGEEALVDIRASFGGVCFAIGLGCLGLSFAGRLDMALWVQIILFSGYAGGRCIGLLLKQGAPSPHRWLLAMEITFLIFAITALMSFTGAHS